MDELFDTSGFSAQETLSVLFVCLFLAFFATGVPPSAKETMTLTLMYAFIVLFFLGGGGIFKWMFMLLMYTDASS